MTQSHRMSVVESLTNTVIGYFLAVTVTWLFFKGIGSNVSFWDSNAITILVTITSLIRSYCLRRFFNSL